MAEEAVADNSPLVHWQTGVAPVDSEPDIPADLHNRKLSVLVRADPAEAVDNRSRPCPVPTVAAADNLAAVADTAVAAGIAEANKAELADQPVRNPVAAPEAAIAAAAVAGRFQKNHPEQLPARSRMRQK